MKDELIGNIEIINETMIKKVDEYFKKNGAKDYKFLVDSKNKTEIETAIKILKTEVSNVLSRKHVIDKTIKYDEEARGD